MSSDLAVFQFPVTGQTIRTLERDGEALVCLTDICRELQHSNAGVALQLVDEDDRVLVDLRETDIPNISRTSINPKMWFVTEAGFYTLAVESKAPRAKQFRRWITHEVLPAIRKTGHYQLEPMDELELAERNVALIKEKRALLARAMQAEQTLAIAAPKADAWDDLASAEGDYAVREAAHILNRDPAITTGQNRLFKLMREYGMIDRNDVPYQKHERHVRLRPRKFTDPNGKKKLEDQVRVTVNGLSYLHKKMGGTMRFSQLIELGPEPEMSIALPAVPEPMPEPEQEALFEVDPQ